MFVRCFFMLEAPRFLSIGDMEICDELFSTQVILLCYTTPELCHYMLALTWHVCIVFTTV